MDYQRCRTTINECNDDILLSIFNNLDFDDRIRLMRVCRRWHSLLTYQLQSTRCLKIGYFLESSSLSSTYSNSNNNNSDYKTKSSTIKPVTGAAVYPSSSSYSSRYHNKSITNFDVGAKCLRYQQSDHDFSTVTLLSQMNKQIMAESRSQLNKYILQGYNKNCLANSTNRLSLSAIAYNGKFHHHHRQQHQQHQLHHHKDNNYIEQQNGNIYKQTIDDDNELIVDNLLSKHSVRYEFDMVCRDYDHIRLASPNTIYQPSSIQGGAIPQPSVNTTARSVAKLFNKRLFQFPADLQTRCFYVARYDYLHRSLKMCSQTLTMLSLGHIILDYRCFVSLVFNCPHIEHLELVGCATDPDETLYTSASITSQTNTSLSQQSAIDGIINRNLMIKNCSIVKDGKRLSRLKHLLIKHCDNLNELMISLLLTITESSLLHLSIQSNQYLTGDCLKHCSTTLEVLELKFCPSLLQRPLEDLIKLKFLTSGKNNHLRNSPSTIQINNDINCDNFKSRTIFNELLGLSVENCQSINMTQLVNYITQYCSNIVSLTMDPITEENDLKKLATLKQLKYVKLNANKHYQAFCLSNRCNTLLQQSTCNRSQLAGS